MTVSQFRVQAVVQFRHRVTAQLTASAVLGFFSGFVGRRPGNDPKLSCSFPLFHSSVPQLQGRRLPWFGAVATVAVIRRMDLVLEAAQHDQVDEAAIPALLSQVTATDRAGSERGWLKPSKHPPRTMPRVDASDGPHGTHVTKILAK